MLLIILVGLKQPCFQALVKFKAEKSLDIMLTVIYLINVLSVSKNALPEFYK